jgi:hypothetical protein
MSSTACYLPVALTICCRDEAGALNARRAAAQCERRRPGTGRVAVTHAEAHRAGAQSSVRRGRGRYRECARRVPV